MLLRLSKNVAILVSDPQKMHHFWMIQRIPIGIFEESVQHRLECKGHHTVNSCIFFETFVFWGTTLLLNIHGVLKSGKIVYIHLCFLISMCIYICRECGWRTIDSLSTCLDPCVVCLERKCTVAAEGMSF